MLQTAYRGRLKKLVLLDAITGFQPFYEKVAKPFMKPRTAELVEFVRWVEAPKRFPEIFGEALAATMLKEAEENRASDWEDKSWTTFYAGDLKDCEEAKTVSSADAAAGGYKSSSPVVEVSVGPTQDKELD